MADRVWNPILVPSAEQWSLKSATRSGGQSFSGAEQVIASPAARWTATLSIPCATPDTVLAMRVVLALGRSQVWIVGPVEVSRAPWPVDPWTGAVITDRRQVEGAQPPYATALDVSLAEAVGANATALTVTREAGGLLRPGQFLSLGGRLHSVVDLTTPDPTDPASGRAVPGRIGLAIRPWTRAAYPAGEPVSFGRPVGRMRLASDDTGALQLQLSRTGTVQLDLIEAF